MAVSTQIDHKLSLKSTYFGLEQNTTRGLIISWSFNGTQAVTEKYTVEWYKRVHRASVDSTGQDTYWEKVRSDDIPATDPRSASYHAAQEDTGIRVVVSAIAKTDANDTKYWNDGTYKFEQIYPFTEILETPPVPSVTIDDDKLVINVYDLDTSKWTNLDLEIVRDAVNGNGEEIYEIVDCPNVPILKDTVTHKKQKTSSGQTYRVRCRGRKEDLTSEWTIYSEPVSSRPEAPVITGLAPYSNKSVRIEFEAATKSDSYEINWFSENDAKIIENYQYLLQNDLTTLFDRMDISKSKSVNHDELTETSADDAKAVTLVYYLTPSDDLEQGGKYYIRIKATKSNSDDPSRGSETIDKSLKSFVFGTDPKAPTTWSSVSSAIIGEDEYVNLYWNHNSEDQSILLLSSLSLTIGGQIYTPPVIGDEADEHTQYADDGSIIYSISWEKYDYAKNSTRVCKLNLTNINGTDVKWKVATCGIIPDDAPPVFGEWSVERIIKIYSQPVFNAYIMSTGDVHLPTTNEKYNGQSVYKMSKFPLSVWLEVGESLNHIPISYTINIMPLVETSYKTVDKVGNELIVDSKTKLYSKYIPADSVDAFNWFEDIMPNDVALYNSTTYQITCSVTMNSGITASSTKYFITSWEEDFYLPGAEIGINYDNLTAIIRPYVDLEDDQYDSDVIFSVFRREYDGTYVEIESNINGSYVWVEDPHPALNYARYRIVARSVSTGSVSYHDTSPIPVGEFGVVIQWDERWQTYDGSETDRIGSMLKLYYNIRKSFSNDVDVSFVNYMGREHPVSYYGTHKGEKMTWSVDIPKTDKETLYAIRRLSRWAGDVYVREPSGVGYWANIKVSYNEDYDSLVIPISFDITRVEGGI